jgi:hypothetical protein
MFKRRFPLPDRSEGQVDLWATVCVRLNAALNSTSDLDNPPVAGYFRNFGVRLNGVQSKELLTYIIDDGAVDWDDTSVSEIDPQLLDDVIRKAITAPDASGVWYRSGKMYFPASEDTA